MKKEIAAVRLTNNPSRISGVREVVRVKLVDEKEYQLPALFDEMAVNDFYYIDQHGQERIIASANEQGHVAVWTKDEANHHQDELMALPEF